MKIVIDIDKKDYEYIKDYDTCMREDITEKLYCSVYNGTPLPENHGRIVDLDTVTVEEDTDKGVLWLDAPTILEASYGK